MCVLSGSPDSVARLDAKVDVPPSVIPVPVCVPSRPPVALVAVDEPARLEDRLTEAEAELVMVPDRPDCDERAPGEGRLVSPAAVLDISALIAVPVSVEFVSALSVDVLSWVVQYHAPIPPAMMRTMITPRICLATSDCREMSKAEVRSAQSKRSCWSGSSRVQERWLLPWWWCVSP